LRVIRVPFTFYAVFIAEEIDGIWDKGPEDTNIVDVQTPSEAFDIQGTMYRDIFL
jgi:hypothetical protein